MTNTPLIVTVSCSFILFYVHELVDMDANTNSNRRKVMWPAVSYGYDTRICAGKGGRSTL